MRPVLLTVVVRLQELLFKSAANFWLNCCEIGRVEQTDYVIIGALICCRLSPSALHMPTASSTTALSPELVSVSSELLCLVQLSVGRGDLQLCRDVQVQIAAGQIWQVAGENGTGKTTLLLMLAGILPVQVGQLRWRNQPAAQWSALYIGHASGLNSSLSVLDNLRFLCGLNTQAVTTAQLFAAIEQVGLAGYEFVAVARLSSGQKRRVQLARLWLPNPAELWLLDEPLTALDVRMVTALNQRLSEHAAQGGRVVLTSHQPVHAVTHQLDLQRYRLVWES